MNGVVGGDLDTLADLKRTLEQAQQDAENLASTITSSVESAVWTGTNADKFRDAWAEFKPTLDVELKNALQDAETDVKNQHNGLAEATGDSRRI